MKRGLSMAKRSRLGAASALWIMGLAAPVQAQVAPDSDGDGVVDTVDAVPCDGRVAAQAFVPADRSYGMLLFEDLWPKQGDFDFNDVVLAYHQVLNLDAAGQLTSLRMELDVMAVGARFKNGLALHLPVPRGAVETVNLTVAGAPQGTLLWGGEAEAVITLADNLHPLFQVPDGTWVNSDPNAATRPVVHMTLDVRLLSGQAVSAAEAPFDLFIYDPTRGVEVHRPEYRGTASLDPALFGTADDGTSAVRAFVTKGGIPFALNLPELAAYPMEGVSLDQLYPNVVAFGQSGGTQAQDYYRSVVQTQHMFAGQVAPTPLVAAGSPDTSCFSPDPGVCGPAVGTGHVDAPTTGLCARGTASAVSAVAAQFTWTCTGFYSGPTACSAPDYLCTPNAVEDCSAQISNGTGTRTCSGAGDAYTTCTVTSCNPGFFQSGNACVPQVCAPSSTRSCAVSNGAGAETCNNAGTGYGPCQVTACDAGYSLNGGACVLIGATDADRDGLSSAEESVLGTSDANADSDGDGIRDGIEVAMGTNPKQANGRPAAVGTPISSCTTLSAGGTYHLTQNLVGGGNAPCIDVQAGGLTLDCRGYTIAGDGTGQGIQVYVHKYNVTLRNCEVRDFDQGIRAYVHNYDLTVTNSASHHNTTDGVYTGHHNYRTTLADNRFTFNGGVGVNLTDWAEAATLQRNTVSNNVGTGVYIWQWGYDSACSSPPCTYSACSNQVSGNGACEYQTWSYQGPTQFPQGCLATAPAEPSCPGMNPAADQDGDGVRAGDELTAGTSDALADSDGDGLSDGVELAMGRSPTAASARPAASGTAVSGCATLSGSGTYYLANDITTSGNAPCIQIDSGNSTLDCRGHKITGDGTGQGIYVYVHKYNVTIKNCEVRRFDQGIRAYVHNYDLTLANNAIHHNTTDGVFTGHHNYRSVVRDNRVTYNGATGINLTDWAEAATLRRNVVSDNVGNGVYIWQWGYDSACTSPPCAYLACSNQVANNGACEYQTWSYQGPTQFPQGCLDPAPAEPSCP
jgi:LruC domain-containing protein